jgi:hypothetical protein
MVGLAIALDLYKFSFFLQIYGMLQTSLFFFLVIKDTTRNTRNFLYKYKVKK